MDSKKIFLLPVIISLVGHVALIAAGSMVDLRENVKAAELFTVQIAESEPLPQPPAPKEEKPKVSPKQKLPKKQEPVRSSQTISEEDREDTVDLGSVNVKYAEYLTGVKKTIMKIWKYPDEALRKSEIGVVVILMSIEADGSLSQLIMTSSSGSASLDQGTLDVIKAASPFKPLPAQYHLSRLNITASFRYQ